nr:DDT domain-containing protein DDR4 [Ipomoea batatas]GMD55598.1 DDT domain-containing protein DDR4 [Ipomoea batatas]
MGLIVDCGSMFKWSDYCVISSHFIHQRRERPARECTKRATARLQAADADAEAAAKERRKKAAARKERFAARLLREEEEEKSNGSEEDEEGVEGEDGSPSASRQQCGKIVTPLVGEPEPSQLLLRNLCSMWQLASILNFFNASIDIDLQSLQLYNEI